MKLADRDPQWQDHIRALVTAAPDMTPAQVAKLAALFDYTEEPIPA